MFVVDTNILLYAAIEDFPHHKKARDLVEEWRSSAISWHSTWGIFYEFLRVSTHPKVFKSPLDSRDAWKFLEALLSSHGFSLLLETERHSSSINTIFNTKTPPTGNLWHDAHIVAVMLENGIQEIFTADTDFHKFKEIKVTSPF